jgi:hypothetical protein
MLRTRILVATIVALAVAAPAFAITDGSLDGTAHPAVGLLLGDRGKGLEPDCSGFLVSPTVFVTAAHCQQGLVSRNVGVTFDSTYTSGSNMLAGTFVPDPLWGQVKGDSHDVAVVVLHDAVTNVVPYSLPGIGTVDKPTFKTVDFTNVGYGLVDVKTAPDFVRRQSLSSLTNVKPTEIVLANKPGGVCFGDSGGPRLVGTTVVAITSIGNANCTGQSVSYRLDTQEVQDFLAAYATRS